MKKLIAMVMGLAAGVAGAKDIQVEATDGLLAAVAEAEDGDVIVLSAKTYTLADEFTLSNEVTIRGAGIDKTIIKQTGSDKRVLALSNVNARVEYCTLTGGRLKTERGRLEGDMGGCGVLIYGPGGTLSHCRITDNQTSINQNRGIGIDEHSANAVIEDCIIDNNTYTAGSNGSYAGIRTQGGTYTRCLIVENKGHNGGGVYVNGPAKFSWCTIAGNRTQNGYGAIALMTAGATFENCVIAGNFTSSTDTSTTAPEYSGTASTTFSNCAFPNSIEIKSAVVKGTPFQCDVFYVDPSNHDYRQRIISGAKDVGYYAPFDYDTFGCDFTLSTDSLFTGETVCFTAAINGLTEGETASCTWTVTQPDNTTVELTGAVADFQPTQVGSHSVKLVVTKAGAGPVEYVQANCFVAASREAHVSTAAELVAAIANGRDGTVITCAAGTYELNGMIELGKGIRLIGAGPETTTLKQTKLKNRVVKLDHANDWVEGFTLTGGNSGGNKGAGVEYYNGMGVYIGVNGGTLTNCCVTGNTNSENWNHGMGVYMIGPGLVSHCVITNNTRRDGVNQYGGGVYASNGTIDNCLVAFNKVNNLGGGIYAGGAAKIRNCTICGNAVVSEKGGGIYWQNQNAQAQCVNTIVAGNKSAASDTTAGRPEWASNTSKATIQSTCFPSAVGIAGLSGTPLLIDPVFVDAEAGDFHVMPSSLTRDKGTDYEGMPEGDLDGSPRKSGETDVDLGCYEYDATQFGAAFEGPSDPRGFKDVAVIYTASASGVDESQVTFSWTITSPSGDETAATGKVYEFGASEYGIWTISMTATAGGVTSEPYEATYSVCPPDLYVVEPTDENIAKAAVPFDSWDNASTNLLELMRVWALPGCTIHLGEGTIPVGKRVDLSDNLKLVGQGWTKTTLRQTAKTTSVLYLNHEKALVSGMTITGLNAEKEIHSRGAVMIEANGGTVEDCRITGNRYTVGGGVNQQCGVGITLNGEKAVCRRCIIDRNEGKVSTNNNRGGGVQGLAGLLENCLVCCNTNQHAGGIYVSAGSSSFTIRNCTVYGNVGIGVDSGSYGHYGVGGLGIGSGKAIVENTIFAANTSPNQTWTTGGYPEWRVSGGSVEFSNCMLPEGINWPANATDCLNGDPLFVDVSADDFHIQKGSPCVNGGVNNGAYTAESLDLDHNLRVFNFGRRSGKPDLGCYETPWGSPGMILLVK